MPIQFHSKVVNEAAESTILFLHGFMGSCHDWDEVTGYLTDFRCVSLDLPGHGRTTTGDRRSLSFEGCAKEIIRFMDDNRMDKTDIIGYSMGGRLALYLTIAYPDRFDRTLVESASAGLPTESERSQRRKQDEQLAVRLELGGVARFVREWYNQPLFESSRSDPVKLEKLVEKRCKNDQTSLIRSLQSMGLGCQPSLWERLSEIRQPLLLIVGELDSKFCQIADQIAQRCQTAMVSAVSNCGHNVHWEDPLAFANRVQSFLA
ncbi:MAG: 2-succinyl-6-hydroxy-2,4-cyclohexadiene-1-carboxylate synthase [Candidatus Zixiibacteriota bacterium]